MEDKEKKTTMDEVHETALKWCDANDGAILLLTYNSKSGVSSLTTHGKSENQATSLIGTLMQEPDLYNMIKSALEAADELKKKVSQKSPDKVAS